MKILTLFFGMLMLANTSNAESPREQLKQLVEQLQTNPDNNALREQIINLAQQLKPAPAVPDAAERRMARGTEAFKEAKSTAEYQAAVKEFQQAILAAPWSADAYYNLGLAQDKAEDYEGSLASLKLAQLASPDSKDIKDLYYKVEYQRDKANGPEAQLEKFIQSLDGGVWRCEHSNYNDSYLDTEVGHTYIVVSGHTISESAKTIVDSSGYRVKDVDYDPNIPPEWKTTVTGHKFKAPHPAGQGGSTETSYSDEVTISDDGRSIVEERNFVVNGQNFNGILHYVRIQ